MEKSIAAFLDFVRAGLWEKDQSPALKADYKQVDFSEVYRVAQEQSVVGLVAAGLETSDERSNVPKDMLLQVVGDTLQLEQRNKAMNSFIEQLITEFKQKGIHSLIVKGQGIGQCYRRPLWRACGDVDLLLDTENYQKAQCYLSTIAEKIADENEERLHLGFTIQGWEVELHGTLRCKQGRMIDQMIDEVQADTFVNNRVRIWKNGSVEVLLPAPDNDVIFVFTHFLEHFFGNGVGLRQICDWCRLLWTYRNRLNVSLLEKRLRKAGLMTEWKAFASLAVNSLEMPKESMPLYDDSNRWKRMARRVLDIIMETGNMGHNRDMSYQQRYSVPVYKLISFCRNTWDSMRRFMIFPKDVARVWAMKTREGILSLGKV